MIGKPASNTLGQAVWTVIGLLRRTGSPCDGQLANAVDLLSVVVLQLSRGNCQAQSGQSPGQRGEGDLHLGAGEVHSEALVHAVTEAEVSASVAVDVQKLWPVGEVGVPVPGGQIDEHDLASANQLAADGEVLEGHAVDHAVHDCEVAH